MRYELFSLHDYVETKYPLVSLEVTTTRDKIVMYLSFGDYHIGVATARETIECENLNLELEIDKAVSKLIAARIDKAVGKLLPARSD